MNILSYFTYYKSLSFRLRASRIARRTDLPAERKTSTDRSTIAGPYRGNYVTPIKTPAKGLCFPPTIEKRSVQVDKKWAIEESARISEYLRSVQADISKDFNNRADGIRSMSTKDFVTILNFFLGSVGNRLEIKSAKDYVEDTIKCMEKLKYPYNLTKSSLKTPTAPHSFPNIVQLLSWLKSLHMHQLNEGWEDEFLDYRENVYPNLETQKYMQLVCTESFQIWDSNQSEEDDQQFTDLKDKAIAKIIHERTGIPTLPEFELRNEQTKKKCDGIKKEIDSIKIPEEQEQKLLTLESEVENYQSEINVLELNKKHVKSEILEIITENDRLQLQRKEMQAKLDKLKNAINGQKATVDERDSQVNKILYLEAKVNAMKNTLKEIQENCSNDIVKETRLMTKIPIIIGKLNGFMSRMEDHTNSNFFGSINLEENNNFPYLLETVQKIQMIVNEAELSCQEKNNSLKQETQDVKEDIDILDEKISKMQMEVNGLTQKKIELENIYMNLHDEVLNVEELCTIQISKLSSDLEQKEMDIRNKELTLNNIQNKVIPI